MKLIEYLDFCIVLRDYDYIRRVTHIGITDNVRYQPPSE